MQDRFEMMDENADAAIQRDEAAKWVRSVFLAMDSDESGDLTFEEYMAVRMGAGAGRNPERQAAKQEEKAARFPQMDSDGNGSLSEAEFLANGETRFSASDQDDDGQLSFDEFRSHHRPL